MLTNISTITWILIPTIINSHLLPRITNDPSNKYLQNISFLEEVIEENEMLTEIEKDLILRMENLIKENPYLDLNKVYQSLKNVQIIKIEDSKEKNRQTLGMYSYSQNQIKIIEDNENHDILIHELIHCIYTNKKNQKLPSYFTEGMTELLANEYFSENPYIEEENYPFEITMVKMFCEMIGPEKVLETYTTGNGRIIFNELSRVMTEEKTEEFLKNVNQMFQQYKSGTKGDSTLNKQVLAYLDAYYQNKSTMNDDIYLYNRSIIELLSSERPNVNYRLYILENNYYRKAYFSKKLQLKSYEAVWEESKPKEKNIVI